MRKISRKGLVRKLDTLVSEFILARDGGKCVMCGSTVQVGNGHIFSRRNLSLRWDVRPYGNCHAQCWKHNFLHSSRDRYPYYNWYVKKFGQDKFDKLHSDWAQITKMKNFELAELVEKLKEK